MVVTKGDIGLHYISIFQYQHDQSHDRGEGCRRTAPGRNILQLSGCHKSHVKIFFYIVTILSGSKYYGLDSELCTHIIIHISSSETIF